MYKHIPRKHGFSLALLVVFVGLFFTISSCGGGGGGSAPVPPPPPPPPPGPPFNLDTTFGSAGKVMTDIGSNDYARAVAIQDDGKIVATGFTAGQYGFGNVPPSTSTFALVRYNMDGSLDTTFGGTGKVGTAIGSYADDYASAMAIQGDGKIVVAGTSFGTLNFDFALVRYNTDGSLDTMFGGTGKVTTNIGTEDIAYAVAIQNDGKILAAGLSWTSGNYDFALARYNTDGSLDTTFGGTGKVTTSIGGGDDVAYAVTIQADGKIVAVGYSTVGTSIYGGFNNDFALVRYNTDGSLDTTFGTNGMVITEIGTGSNIAKAVVIQGDGKIVAAGYSDNGPLSSDPSTIFALARYNTDGNLDTTFGTSGKVKTKVGHFGDDRANAVAIQNDGKIMAAGYSNSYIGNNFALVRYNTDGSLDGMMTEAIGVSDAQAYAIAIQGDGKIVAGGTSWNGANYDFALVRYSP